MFTVLETTGETRDTVDYVEQEEALYNNLNVIIIKL